MAIFPRRVVQCELDSLRPNIVKPERENDIIRRLNSRRRQAIAAEWEVVVVASFSRLAEVSYERVFGSGRPDLFVRSDGNGAEVEFIADIIAVSDEETLKRNPAQFFFSEFRRVAVKYGLTNGGFDIRIGSHEFGTYPDKRQQLLLPPKSDIPRFLSRELNEFFNRVRRAPTTAHVFSKKDSSIDVSIAYDPNRLGGTTGGYAHCTAPFSLKRNPLFEALNAKATQLNRSSYCGLKGIVVVDGDCYALICSRGGTQWSTDDIVEEFLRKHSYIDFVTTTCYENRCSWGKIEHGLRHKVYWQRPFDRLPTSRLYSLFNTALRSLPPVTQSPHNAWLSVRSGKEISRGCELGAYGDWIPSQKLGYSSRTFLALVAGTIS